jgi:hypothetical protein
MESSKVSDSGILVHDYEIFYSCTSLRRATRSRGIPS